MKNRIFLIAPTRRHDRGNVIEGESEIFYHFNESLKCSDENYVCANFIIKDGKISLDVDDLKNKLKSDDLVLIDINYTPGESDKIYPSELINVLKNLKCKVICFCPDLIEKINYEPWINLSNFIIGFSKSGVDWANKKYNTQKFCHFPTLPMKKFVDNNVDDFMKRPFDFGYIGSNKIFRVNFISSLLKRGGNKISSLIISSFRTSEKLKNTEDCHKFLTECKFYLCTRASFYETYSNNPFKTTFHDGRFASRISEALSCGCIPMYWQPKKNGIFTKLKEKIFFSNKFSRYEHDNTENDPNSLPFDSIARNELEGIVIVENADEAIKIIRSLNSNYASEKLRLCSILYNNYVKPKNFFNFIERELSKIND